MIKKLILKNIQSHEETALEFDPGINCIIGSSNAGKSAILRALYWVRYNRPLGVDVLASHWALNDRGALKNEIFVQFENDNGTVMRRRTKVENQYVLGDKILNVVKCDVPAEVEALLGLSDVNIQKQLDQPFLLSETSGEIARYFNKVVRLDIIDKVLGNAEAARRKLHSEIGTLEEIIKNAQDRLRGFDFLPTTERLLDKYDRVSQRRDEIEAEVHKLQIEINDFEEAWQKWQQKNYEQAKEKIVEIEQCQNERRLLEQEIINLEKSIFFIENVKIYPDFSNYKNMLEKLISYKPDTAAIEGLSNIINIFEKMSRQMQDNKRIIEELKKQLPAICPLCGGVMKTEAEK